MSGTTSKKSSYAEYRKTRSEMQDRLVAQKIVHEILKENEQKKEVIIQIESQIDEWRYASCRCRSSETILQK